MCIIMNVVEMTPAVANDTLTQILYTFMRTEFMHACMCSIQHTQFYFNHTDCIHLTVYWRKLSQLKMERFIIYYNLLRNKHKTTKIIKKKQKKNAYGFSENAFVVVGGKKKIVLKLIIAFRNVQWLVVKRLSQFSHSSFDLCFLFY